MAKRKVLGSVARSIADSFTSLVNWGDDDYLIGHLLKAAHESGMSLLSVDLLSGRAEPDTLLPPPVRRSVEAYCADLPRLVTDSESDMTLVTGARMTIAYDMLATRWAGGSRSETPYECKVVITDDAGKTHEAVLTGWWWSERV